MKQNVSSFPGEKYKGQHWNNRFLSNDGKILLTWDPQNAHTVTLCDGQRATMTDQGIPILSMYKAYKIHSKRFVNDNQIPNDGEPTSVLPVQLQALENRISQIYVHGLNSGLNQLCHIIHKMQIMDLMLTHSQPTLVARYLFNNSEIMASLNGKLMEIWPCTPVDAYKVRPINPERCTEWIPLNMTAKGVQIQGYLDPKTNIVY